MGFLPSGPRILHYLRPAAADPFVFRMSGSPLIGLPGVSEAYSSFVYFLCPAVPLIGKAKRVHQSEEKGAFLELRRAPRMVLKEIRPRGNNKVMIYFLIS